LTSAHVPEEARGWHALLVPCELAGDEHRHPITDIDLNNLFASWARLAAFPTKIKLPE
jgi:hypothetical protein